MGNYKSSLRHRSHQRIVETSEVNLQQIAEDYDAMGLYLNVILQNNSDTDAIREIRAISQRITEQTSELLGVYSCVALVYREIQIYLQDGRVPTRDFREEFADVMGAEVSYVLSPEEVRPKVPFFYVLISGARFEGEFSKAQFEKFASQAKAIIALRYSKSPGTVSPSPSPYRGPEYEIPVIDFFFDERLRSENSAQTKKVLKLTQPNE